MKRILFLILAITFFLGVCNAVMNEKPINYLDQQEPGLTPELFAPGIISTGMGERNLFFSGWN